MPLRKKNVPIRIRASWSKIGYRAYIWKSPMSANAPNTPSDLATTNGTPYFGSPYLKGAYANEVQGDAKALCHVSDLDILVSVQTSKLDNGRKRYQNPVRLSALYNGPNNAGLPL